MSNTPAFESCECAHKVNTESLEYGSAKPIRGNALVTDCEGGHTVTKLLGAVHDKPLVENTATIDSDGNTSEGDPNFLLDPLMYAEPHKVPLEAGGTAYIYLMEGALRV